MAYLRREKEIVEMDFPLDKVWEAIQKAVASLEWTIEEKDEAKHHAKAKTKANFMAYPSILNIDCSAVSENVTRVSVAAETPVTTLTGIVDFGRTNERLTVFLTALSKEFSLEKGEKADKTEN